MKPGRILITGAHGFVGGYLLPALRKAYPEAALHHADFDITDATATEHAVEAIRPDACVHLAAVASLSAARQAPDAAWRVNLHGTLNLARAILAYVPDCVLVFASSADAYGASFLTGKPLSEAAPLAPMNIYAATKAAADLALGAMASERLRVVRLRLFNHTGPGQSDSYVIAAFAGQIARIKAGLQAPLLRVGALEIERDFLDVRDVCRAYVACLRNAESLTPGTILNIASGTRRSLKDVLDELLALAGITPKIETDPARLRPADVPVASGNAARARILLDWKPQIPWTETLEAVLAASYI